MMVFSLPHPKKGEKLVKVLYHAHRQKGNYDCGTISRDRGLVDAMVAFFQYELGYGGQVVDVSPNRIVARTLVMGDVDTTTVEGSEEAIRPFIEGAGYFQKLRGSTDQMVSRVEKAFERFPEKDRGKPIFLTILGPIFATARPARLALLLGLGIRDEDEIKAGVELSDDDLQPVLELRFENPGMKIQDIKSELLGFPVVV